MHHSKPISLLALLATTIYAIPTSTHAASHSVEKPVIWVAGDSTTAPDGGHNGTEGWGQYLQYSFGDNARVNNSAYAGRSARSVCLDPSLTFPEVKPRPWETVLSTASTVQQTYRCRSRMLYRQASALNARRLELIEVLTSTP